MMSSDSLYLIFEDDFLLAIFKPALLHSVALPKGNGGASLADWLREKYPAAPTVSEKPEDCGLIQRLDYETSGVIIAAKTKAVWHLLKQLLLSGEIGKKYLVLVDGVVEETKQIESFIGTPKKRGKRVYSYLEDPRNNTHVLKAKTKFTPLRVLPNGKATLCEASAPVARRHQIRLHASELGHPLCGDVLYRSTSLLSDILNLAPSTTVPPFFLHANFARLIHPVTQTPLVLEVEPPAYLALV